MRLVCVLFTFENNAGPTDLRTDGRTDGRTDRRTDTSSYRDATAHLKTQNINGHPIERGSEQSERASERVSAAERASKASRAEQANE